VLSQIERLMEINTVRAGEEHRVLVAVSGLHELKDPPGQDAINVGKGGQGSPRRCSVNGESLFNHGVLPCRYVLALLIGTLVRPVDRDLQQHLCGEVRLAQSATESRTGRGCALPRSHG
jgi:hypothetical protein